MCGIVYVKRKGKKCANKMVMKRFAKQKERGTDGFGFVTVVKNKIEMIRRTEKEKEIRNKIEKTNAGEIMFHHRFPTSTINIKEVAHPITVSNRKLKFRYYVIHNGIITNDEELKAKHEKLGFKYTTEIIEKKCVGKIEYFTGSGFNDSECLAIELALLLEGKIKKLGTKGSIAFVLLQVEKASGNIVARFCGRNDNPLYAYRQDDFLTLTSRKCGAEIQSGIIYGIGKDDSKLYTTDFFIPSNETDWCGGDGYEIEGKNARMGFHGDYRDYVGNIDTTEAKGFSEYTIPDFSIVNATDTDIRRQMDKLSFWRSVAERENNYDLESDIDDEVDVLKSVLYDRELKEQKAKERKKEKVKEKAKKKKKNG